jgi:hypothetical protein
LLLPADCDSPLVMCHVAASACTIHGVHARPWCARHRAPGCSVHTA